METGRKISLGFAKQMLVIYQLTTHKEFSNFQLRILLCKIKSVSLCAMFKTVKSGRKKSN